MFLLYQNESSIIAYAYTKSEEQYTSLFTKSAKGKFRQFLNSPWAGFFSQAFTKLKWTLHWKKKAENAEVIYGGYTYNAKMFEK